MSNPERHIYIGTSGWSYSDWKGTFYPGDLPAREWFQFYSRQFPTVEINATFYHLPKLKTVHGWRDHAPPGFVFAVKGSRFISHIKRLTNLGNSLQAFSRRIQPLRGQTGVVLWQLPPSLKMDGKRLHAFLRRQPKAFWQAMEFRDPSWLNEETLEILRRHQTAFVSVSSRQMPMDLSVTSDVVYLRFHGLAGGARHDYSRSELQPWAEHIREQARLGRTVYVYFNNDAGAHAPRNAMLLREMVGQD